MAFPEPPPVAVGSYVLPIVTVPGLGEVNEMTWFVAVEEIEPTKALPRVSTPTQKLAVGHDSPLMTPDESTDWEYH
jgi:hypothetical protein